MATPPTSALAPRTSRGVRLAAVTLGLPRKTLYDKLKRHGIHLRHSDLQED